MAENLGAKFTIDVSNLKAGLAQANRMIRESESEFKAAAAGMGDWQKNADGLRAKINQLNSTAQIQREKVRALQEEYNRLIAEGMEPTSAKATLMRTNINNATAALNKSEAEASKCTKALDELGNEAEDSGKKAKTGSDGFTVFKGVLADLASSAIKGALNGIKDLGAALVNLGKQSLMSYADFEQLEGGAKKIFDEMDYSSIAADANDAYLNMGMSANQYLESINSVGAAFASTMGDQAGYDTAKKGMQAIADFASGTGKSVDVLNEKYQLITKSSSSYQSIADQFAGILPQTSADFLEQAQAAGILSKDYEKLTAVPVAEYQQAVTAMMEKGVNALGLTGNTAAEAADTMSGSLATMKTSWSNLMTGLADDSANIEQLGKNLVTSVTNVAKNFIPRITQIIQGASKAIAETLPQLVQQIVPLIQQNLPLIIQAVQQAIQTILAVLPELVQGIAPLIPQIVQMIVTLLPQLVDAGIKVLLALIQGITEALPQLIAMLPSIIKQVFDVIIANLPAIIEAGVQLLIALIEGLSEALPQLISYLPYIIETITQVLMDNLPLIIDAGIQIIVALIKGIVQSLPQIISTVVKLIGTFVKQFISSLPQFLTLGMKAIGSLIDGIGQTIGLLIASCADLVSKVVNKIGELPGKMVEAGLNLVKGLWQGINDAKDWVLGKIKGFGESVLNGIKSFFGIHSPSTVMRDQIGVNLAKGIGVGFEEEIPDVQRQIQNSIDDLSAGGFSANINGAQSMATAGGGKSVTINQTNNYAATHTRYELYKSKEDTAAAVKFALMGV